MARRPALRALTLAAAVALAALLAGLYARSPGASACGAFLRIPHTYEAERSRASYLAALDAASVDALFPGDPYFGLPPVESGTRAGRVPGARRVPATLLKAIAWVESSITMASRSVAFNSAGPALVSFDCGYGIMQVTSGMTVPLGADGRPSARQASVATHYGYNVARGAAVLAAKWNEAPERRPIAGVDSASDPALVENWYFATWAYNGFTGPGSRSSNHPLDPSFGAWPRPRYRCDGTQSRDRYPYQELVWGCMASPPAPVGASLWGALPATLPDVTQPQFFVPLSLAKWSYPYPEMDIPTPRPAHTDTVPDVPGDLRVRLFAQPSLDVGESSVLIKLNARPQDARVTIVIENAGTGLLSWIASSDDGWIVVDPPAGVALGSDVACPAGCRRSGELTITVNPTLLPKANVVGELRIVSATSGQPAGVVRVEVDADFEVGAPGVSRAD